MGQYNHWLVTLIVFSSSVNSFVSQNNTFHAWTSQSGGSHHQKVLSGEGKRVRVLLRWEIDLKRETITFDLTAETTGYVGFGLKNPSSTILLHASGEEGMANSDIVIGGIYPNGTSYFTVQTRLTLVNQGQLDYHGVGNVAPVRDESQDWYLHAAYKNTTHTFLRFSRQLDTCDLNDDVRIQHAQPLQIMWALGSTDQVTYHGKAERGTTAVELLTTTLPPPSLQVITKKLRKSYASWKTLVNVKMKQEYAYRCTFHRGPRFYASAHAVAFTPVLDDPKALQHVHHFSFYQCKLPLPNRRKNYYDYYSDLRKTFESLVVQTNGNDCYSNESRIPVRLCMQVMYVWSPGEKVGKIKHQPYWSIFKKPICKKSHIVKVTHHYKQDMFFPEEAGYLLDDGEPFEPSYFMFEVHYENPGEVSNGVTFQVGIEIFYTEQLRQYSAGFLGVAHAVSDSLFIPPYSKEFKIEGRCSAECTQRSVPSGGVTVISVMLHAHLYARKIKLRHFRNKTELPWLAVENEFKFNSQRMVRVSENRKIYPGDSLVLECYYSTLSRNKVTTGGFSSNSEMCTAFLWYFPKIDLDDCSSEFPLHLLHNFIGYQTANDETNRWLKKISNFSTFVDINVNWTDLLRHDVQHLLASNHHASCIIPNHHFTTEKPIKVAQPILIAPEKMYRPQGNMIRMDKTNGNLDEFRCIDNVQKKKWWKERFQRNE